MEFPLGKILGIFLVILCRFTEHSAKFELYSIFSRYLDKSTGLPRECGTSGNRTRIARLVSRSTIRYTIAPNHNFRSKIINNFNISYCSEINIYCIKEKMKIFRAFLSQL